MHQKYYILFILAYIINLGIAHACAPGQLHQPYSSHVAQALNQRSDDFKRLNGIRTEYTAQLQNIEHNGSRYTFPYAYLCRAISEDTLSYVADMCDDICNQIGPKPCKMCIFATGSLGRKEAGLITDLEIGVLLEHQTIETQEYAYTLIQRLADRIALLGETADVNGWGFRLDEADHAPPHHPFSVRHTALPHDKTQGSRLFVTTPYTLAQYYDTAWCSQQSSWIYYITQSAKCASYARNAYSDKKQYYPQEYHDELYKRIAQHADAIYTPLYPHELSSLAQIRELIRAPQHVWGDHHLLDMYYAHRDRVLNTQYVGKETLGQMYDRMEIEKDLKQHSYLAKPTQKLPDHIDIKRNIYRFPQKVISRFAAWCGLEPLDSITTLEHLYAAGWINAACYRDLAHYIDFALHLRLRQQKILQKHTRKIPTNVHAWQCKMELVDQRIRDLHYKQQEKEQASQYDAAWRRITRKLNGQRQFQRELMLSYPGEDASILSSDRITHLRDTCIPIAQKTYWTAQAFVDGDRHAFLRW